MNPNRRSVLKSAGALAAVLATGALKPGAAAAAVPNQAALHAKTTADALKALGITHVDESKDIQIKVPEIAENGAVVPIEVTSNIPGTQTIAVFIDKNPFPFAGSFDVSKGALPFVALRLKVGESSHIRVVATAGGKHYIAAKEVKVTIGGCGG